MRSATLLVVLALALGACTERTVAPVESIATRHPDDGVSLQIQPTPGLYSWSQGNAPTYMGSNTNGLGQPRVCYLTRISGKFASFNEAVKVYLWASSWYLGGSSSSVGIGASARCFTVSSYSGEDTWWEPLNQIVLNKFSESACFLTSIQGELGGTTSLNGDYVKVGYTSNGWVLEGRGTGGSSSQLRARSRCVKPITAYPPPGNFGWTYWQTGFGPTTTSGSTTFNICPLNHVFGAFIQSTSYVQITPGQTTWILSGGNLGPVGGVGTNCFLK